jgi:hypothetical protein
MAYPSNIPLFNHHSLLSSLFCHCPCTMYVSHLQTKSCSQTPQLCCFFFNFLLMCPNQCCNFLSCTNNPCNFYPMSVMSEKHFPQLCWISVLLLTTVQSIWIMKYKKASLLEWQLILYFNNNDKFITFILSLLWSQACQCFLVLSISRLKVNTSQATTINKYKNLNTKLMKCNANIYFNKQCLNQKAIPAFARLKVPHTRTSPASLITQCKSHVKLIITYIYIYIYIVATDWHFLSFLYLAYQCCYNSEINDAMMGWSLGQERQRCTQSFCRETSWEMISWKT